jgi:hypothetical protein
MFEFIIKIILGLIVLAIAAITIKVIIDIGILGSLIMFAVFWLAYAIGSTLYYNNF